MLNMLQEIAEKTAQRVAEEKRKVEPVRMRKQAEECYRNESCTCVP